MADGGLERTGVEAVAEGVDKFVSDLRKMDIAYDQSVNRFRNAQGQFVSFGTAMGAFVNRAHEAARATEQVGQASDKAAKSAASGSSNLLKFFGGFATGAMGASGLNIAVAALSGNFAAAGAAAGTAAIGIINGFVNAVKQAIDTTTQFGINALMTAGGFQEMEFAALASGQAMGISQDKMRAAIKDVTDAGIRYDAAAKTVATLARNNIGLTKAQELANRAQGAAIFLNADSSDSLERLVQATISGETESLKTMGIFVNLNNVYDQHAKKVGKSAAALTEQEKVQARVDAIIKNSAALMDVYAAAMESPTKQLRTLTGRLLPELLAAVGAPFLSAFATVIRSISDFVKALTAAVQEGGALYPVLVQLGAVASIIADGFAGLVGVATDFVKGFSTTFADGLSETAEAALRWGAEIIGALAEGIIEGASGALSAAMQFVGSLLTFWLAPGSDPRVAPLSVWGADAMTQYLSGFQDADFDVLEGLQGTLKNILSGPDFARISQSLIEAIAGGGAGRESFFAELAQSAGDFGAQIAELARRQFELADATKAVTEAEKRYSDAQKGVERAQGKVSSLTAEYNKMLRAGASKEALAAKLKEINAAEDGLVLAQQQQAEAKTDVDAAKEKIDALKEQVNLQERLVKQLVDIAKATADTTKALTEREPKLPKGAGAFAIPEPVMPKGLSDKIASKIGLAIDTAKAKLQFKMAQIFAPIGQAMDRVRPKLFELQLQWQIFTMKLQLFWNTNVAPIVSSITEFAGKLLKMIPPEFWENLGKVAGIMAVAVIGAIALAAAFVAVAAGVVALLNPITVFIAAIVSLPIAFAAVVAGILTWGEVLKVGITTKVQEIYNTVSTKIGQLKTWLYSTFFSIAYSAITTWEGIKTAIISYVTEIVLSVVNFGNTVQFTLVNAFETFKKYMDEVFGPWLQWFKKNVFDPFAGAVEFINGIVGGLIERIKELKRALSNIQLPPALNPGSPTPFEIGLRGIADAMQNLSSVQLPALANGLRTPAPAMAGAYRTAMPTAPAQQIYRQSSVQVGPNYISNGMDVAALQAMIERTFRRELKG